MKMIREVINARGLDNFVLECRMENGEVFHYDMSFVKKASGEMVQPLKDINYFKKACIDEYGSISWPNGLDLDPAVIPMEGKLIGKKECP